MMSPEMLAKGMEKEQDGGDGMSLTDMFTEHLIVIANQQRAEKGMEALPTWKDYKADMAAKGTPVKAPQ